MATSSSSEDEPKKIIPLSHLLTKSRDDLLINLEKCLIDNDLPLWDAKSNSKLQCWIRNISSGLDVSLSINILKLMTCYVMGQDSYDEKVVMDIYLNMLSMSNRVAESLSTERYTKISFWESITEFNMAVLDYNAELISKDILVIGIQFITIVVTPVADHFLRQLYIKSLNNLLEKYPQLARGIFKQQADEYLVCLPACLAEVGDYDFQTSIVELIFRTTGISERKASINKIFPGLDLTIQSLFLRIHDFDPDCRLFLNQYNASLGDNQLVFTFPCHNAQIGQLKLSKPKSSSYEKFWVDFNLRSGTILIMCDRSSNGDIENKSSESTWESLVLYPNEVTSVQLSCLPHTTTLVVELGRDPSEIFASPPAEEDLKLLSEWISIEFSPNKDLKTVCQNMYSDKIIVHDMTPHNSYHKASKAAVAISSKALSSSEAEFNNKPRKSSKHYKMSKTKVPIPAVGTDSSSGNQLWSSSAIEQITNTTKDVAKKVPRKKISKTCIPIKCAPQSESHSATSGVTDEEKRYPNKETENLFENIPQSNMQNEAPTSEDIKLKINTSNEDSFKGSATEDAHTQIIFTKHMEEDGYKTKSVNESKIETSPLKMKDTAEKVANVADEGCTIEVAHTGDSVHPKNIDIDVYKGKEKNVKKKKEVSKNEMSPLKMKERAKKDTNVTGKGSTPEKLNKQENVSPKCTDKSTYKGEGKSVTEKKKEESKVETSPLKIKDSAKKIVDSSEIWRKKYQMEKRDSAKSDTISESHASKDKFDKIFTNTEESTIDETKMIEKEFEHGTENTEIFDMFMNDTTLVLPKTPLRNESDKVRKSPIIGGNSLNKLSEIISSASPEKKMSKCLSLEPECDYAMPTQDQGILLEAMDTLDDTDLNNDLSSTEVKLQNSEDEVDVDIESEEEIPSSIATPSATTPLYKLKKNMELSKSIKNSEGECDKNEVAQKEISKESSITSENAELNVRIESKGKIETKTNGKSNICKKGKDEKNSKEKTNKIKKENLIEDKASCKNVEELKLNDDLSSNKIEENFSKLETSNNINDKTPKQCLPQNKDDNQKSEIITSIDNQQEDSNIDLDEDDFTKSEDIPTFEQPNENISPSKVKKISHSDLSTTEKLFEVIDDINSPLKSLKRPSPSYDNKSSSPNKVVNKSQVNRNKVEQESLKLSSKSPQSGLAEKKNKRGSPSKVLNLSPMKYNVECDQDTNSVAKSPLSALTAESESIAPINITDINELENICSPIKLQKFASPMKKSKSEPCLKGVDKSPVKDNKEDHSQVFKPTLRSRKCKTSSKEPIITSPLKMYDKVSNKGNTPQCGRFKDLSSLSPKNTKTLLIKSKSSSQDPTVNSPLEEPVLKSSLKELPKNLSVNDFDGFSDKSQSPHGPKFKDFSSLISSSKSSKKKNLLIKTQPKTRASSSSKLSVNTSPKKERNSYKAVVKVVESPKLVVELTKLSTTELTKLSNNVNIKEEITRSYSDSLLLEKSIREDVQIVHVTSSVLNPTKDDLVGDKNIKFPSSVYDGIFQGDNISIENSLISEKENSYVGMVQSSYSGKEAVLRYSKEITVLDQITESDVAEANKIKKRDVANDELMIHEEAIDSSQPKAKSPIKERGFVNDEPMIHEETINTSKPKAVATTKKRSLADDELMIPEEAIDTSQPKAKSPRKDENINKDDRNISEGLRSTRKILETYGSNVNKKLGRKTPRKDEVTPVINSKAKIKREFIMARNKKSNSSPARNVTPKVTPDITPSNRLSDIRKSKKKLFNNSDLNILQDTPPSSQSPDVEITSLYQQFNNESKSSQNRNSSKVNVSNNSSDKSTKDLSVYSTYLESPTHLSDEEMCDSLESNKLTSLKQVKDKTRTSIRMKKENHGKNSNGKNGSLISVKKKPGRPKKNSILADSREKKNRFLASPDVHSPVFKENTNALQRHSIYSDFSSEDEFGWLKKKNSEPRIKASRGYGKANWSYRRSQETSSPEWRPVRERSKKKHVELPKAPTPPESYHSTSSINSDSTDDDIFKSVTPKKIDNTEETSGKRITRSFLKSCSNTGKEKERLSKVKHEKRKRKKELSFQKNVPSWCSSISRPESPEILRQNSCSSVESQTPGRDFKLAPGKGLEGIKFDISNNFGFSSPEMATIPEEPAQKRVRKSVDDANIKGLLEGILPKSNDVCRNANMSSSMPDSGVYPLAPNNTPVSPVLAQKEESKVKKHNSYTTYASDKDETEVPCSPRQSTMIDDMASKTLPSLPQFSYVSEQPEDSFVDDDTIRLSGLDREEKSNGSVKLSPLIKSPLNTRLQLSVEDSPPHEGFLIPSQPWTPPQGESDSENDISHEEVKNVFVNNLDQNLSVNEVKSALITSSDEDKGNNPASPELFSLEPNCPLDNAGTQAFSLNESAEKHSPNTPSEPSSLKDNQLLKNNRHFSKEELVGYKEKVCNILVNQENICKEKHPASKTQTAQLLNKVLDKYDKSENIEGASQLTPTSHQNPLETPEVSQRRLFLNMDEIDISGLEPASPITPTRRRMLMHQMDEFRTHIQVSYTRSMALWENVMQILGDKKN